MTDPQNVEYDPSLRLWELIPLAIVVVSALGVLGGLGAAVYHWLTATPMPGWVMPVVGLGFMIGFFVFMGWGLAGAAMYQANPETIHPEVREESPVEFEDGESE